MINIAIEPHTLHRCRFLPIEAIDLVCCDVEDHLDQREVSELLEDHCSNTGLGELIGTPGGLHSRRHDHAFDTGRNSLQCPAHIETVTITEMSVDHGDERQEDGDLVDGRRRGRRCSDHGASRSTVDVIDKGSQRSAMVVEDVHLDAVRFGWVVAPDRVPTGADTLRFAHCPQVSRDRADSGEAKAPQRR